MQDLVDGSRFYESQSPGLGDYFLDTLFSNEEIHCTPAPATAPGDARDEL